MIARRYDISLGAKATDVIMLCNIRARKARLHIADIASRTLYGLPKSKVFSVGIS